MKIMVTGSREFTDYEMMKDAMAFAVGQAEPGEQITLLSGAADGADKMAEKIAANYGCEIHRYPADWENHDSECPTWHAEHSPRYCRRAGYRRNAAMIAEGPDLVLGFFREGATNRGTSMTVKLARAAGITVWTYTDETPQESEAP